MEQKGCATANRTSIWRKSFFRFNLLLEKKNCETKRRSIFLLSEGRVSISRWSNKVVQRWCEQLSFSRNYGFNLLMEQKSSTTSVSCFKGSTVHWFQSPTGATSTFYRINLFLSKKFLCSHQKTTHSKRRFRPDSAVCRVPKQKFYFFRFVVNRNIKTPRHRRYRLSTQ